MLKLLAYLKDIATVLVFFYAISFYFKSFFQLNIFQVAGWWVKNFSSAENGFPLLVGLFFCLVGSYLIWVISVQAVYLSVVGDTTSYLYVGESKKGGMFVDPDNLSAKPFVSNYAFSTNATFKNMYAKTLFVFEKGTNRIGAPKETLSARRLLPMISFGLVLVLVLWVVLHMFGHQVYAAKNYESISNAPPVKDLFEQQSKKIGLTPKQLTFIGMALTFVGFVSYLTMPSLTYGKSAIKINNIIYPGAKIDGKTQSVEKIFYTDSSGSHNRERDTGRRYAVFEFREGLPTPVYVSLYFDETNQPDLYNYLLGTLETQEPQAFKVTPELGLGLIE